MNNSYWLEIYQLLIPVISSFKYIVGDKILTWGTPDMSALDFDNVQYLVYKGMLDPIIIG